MKRLDTLFILAGEASADLLGNEIMMSFGEETRYFGVGGLKMRGMGFDNLAPQESLMTLGLLDSLLSVPRLLALADELIAVILDRRPDAVLTIDAKAFSAAFARRLKKAMAKTGWSAPIIHLVAPTVWAWGGWRAKKLSRSIDRLLCLFPFEPEYFTCHGLTADFVGHPLLEATIPSRSEARASLGLNENDRVLVLLPGSRGGEIKRLLPKMIEAEERIHTSRPDIVPILPASPYMHDRIVSLLGDHPRIRLVAGGNENIMMALAAGDAGMICSGTVALEAALAGLNGVVIYHSDVITYAAGKLLVDEESIVLPNKILGERLYEFIWAGRGSAPYIAGRVLAVMDEPEAFRFSAMVEKLSLVMQRGKRRFGQACRKAILESVRGSN